MTQLMELSINKNDHTTGAISGSMLQVPDRRSEKLKSIFKRALNAEIGIS